MENASKALIIAGAILLSILLISLGMMIFGQARDALDNSGFSKAQLEAFNSHFIQYEKDGQKGSVVKSLINEVIASNADTANQNAQALVKVTIDGDVFEGDDITSSGIQTNQSYNVTLDYVGGRVENVNIDPA